MSDHIKRDVCNGIVSCAGPSPAILLQISFLSVCPLSYEPQPKFCCVYAWSSPSLSLLSLTLSLSLSHSLSYSVSCAWPFSLALSLSLCEPQPEFCSVSYAWPSPSSDSPLHSSAQHHTARSTERWRAHRTNSTASYCPPPSLFPMDGLRPVGLP